MVFSKALQLRLPRPSVSCTRDGPAAFLPSDPLADMTG